MKKKGFVTIKDIARELGLSTSTVSRALRDQPDVSANTKASVQKLAEQWNYRRNLLAANMSEQRTGLIGVIIPTFSGHFFSRIISGIQEYAFKEGFRTIFSESQHIEDRERMDTFAMLSVRVDGMIAASAINPAVSKGYFQQVLDLEVPFVMIDIECPGLAAPVVKIDDYHAAYEATEYLIKSGCKRLAHFGGNPHETIPKERKAGFLAALQDYQLPINEDWILAIGYEIEPAEAAMKELLASSATLPDGVLAVSDRSIYGAMKAIKQKGLKIPEDISLIGFSDNPLSTLVEPQISSVSQPAQAMGKKAASLIINSINQDRSLQGYQPYILDTQLVLRETTRKIQFTKH
ncbi:MAG: LacI family DNA-binding transcriptional regulator [Bacteroidota bacterium]